MRLRTALLGLAFALTSCEFVKDDESIGEVQARRDTDKVTASPTAADWQIGPVIYSIVDESKERNYSINMPLRPSQDVAGVIYFDIVPGAEVDYVTFKHPPLSSYRHIRARFAIEAAEGASLQGSLENGKCAPGSPTAIFLYFQKLGDNWNAPDGRWWSVAGHFIQANGQFTLEAPLEPSAWAPVVLVQNRNLAIDFQTAKAASSRVGFTFANCIGKGHGAIAVGGTVRVKLLEFTIE